MIAEIEGKLSKSRFDRAVRLEDQLTGNFFGSLRYLPFDIAMKPILKNSVIPPEALDCLDSVQLEEWDDRIHFWRKWDEDGTEPDVVIDLDEIVILIEVKFNSGFSADADTDDAPELVSNVEHELKESNHQLKRESDLLINQYPNATNRVLLLLARETFATKVYENIDKLRDSGKPIITPGVDFGYITWQKTLTELRGISGTDGFQNLIISDLVQLLEHKGFEQFENFVFDDMEVVNPDAHWEYDVPYSAAFRFDFIKRIREDLYYGFK